MCIEKFAIAVTENLSILGSQFLPQLIVIQRIYVYMYTIVHYTQLGVMLITVGV